MHDLTDEERKQILGEVLMDELKAIREGIADLPTRTEFNELRADVEELKTDMKVVRAAIKDHSHEQQAQGQELTAVKQRLTPLEDAA